MASSLKPFAFFFIISLLSSQIHARESQFFSKVSATTPTTTTTTTAAGVNNRNNEQDPSFIPETQNAYGLYGQESSQYPTTTTQLTGSDPYTATPTTNLPYKTQETYTNTNNNDNYYYSNNNNEFNDVNSYEDKLGETQLQDTRYTTTSTSENQNNNYYSGGDGYRNVEKQGMSDTRFLENGKYYYDPNTENYNYNNNQYQNTKNSYENTRGGFYSNSNQNSNEYKNMERSQNVEDFQYDP